MKQKIKNEIVETVGNYGIKLDENEDLFSQIENVDKEVKSAVDKTLSANYSDLKPSDKVSYIRTFGSDEFYKLRHRRKSQSEDIRHWSPGEKAEFIKENGIDNFKKRMKQNQ